MNYVERHFGDWARDTAHLSVIEDGAYNRLCDLYYVRESPLPSDIEVCCRLARASSATERKAVAMMLAEFFQPTPEGWRHKRCDQEIARCLQKKEKARSSANARWSALPPDRERNANAMRTHSGGNAPNHQTPVTSNQTPVGKEKARLLAASDLDIPVELAEEFLAHRKRKRAPLTAAAWTALKAEADKAHVTIEDAIRKALMRGWTGFESSWLNDQKHVNGSRGKQIELEERNAAVLAEFVRRGSDATS